MGHQQVEVGGHPLERGHVLHGFCIATEFLKSETIQFCNFFEILRKNAKFYNFLTFGYF